MSIPWRVPQSPDRPTAAAHDGCRGRGASHLKPAANSPATCTAAALSRSARSLS